MAALKPPKLTQREVAALCLAHLAENPEQLADFLGISGLAPNDLRKAVGSDQLGRGLIDYFAANEALLLAFCANNAMRPEAFMRVWAELNPAG